ncbi:hypothetical protein [Mycobacterium decipiens]|uniref:Lipoprotein LpqS n=1 Tax=Mycobacterium decipiens TaxID=1430326 RepID=A0A1X2LSE6_9MYCO|nr:hypothetical protein [Mycobacterium decipiens]OSC39626.1 hypothetical protein B8W66_16500 [Mycobacterium decipiens]
MRSAIVAVALALLVVTAQCWLPQLHRHVAHPNHPLTTSVGGEFIINTDHAHIVDNSTPPCPQQFATAVLPRSATPVFPSDAVAAAGGITAVLSHLVVPAGRGPPPALRSVRTGQDLLTRFCLARR